MTERLGEFVNAGYSFPVTDGGPIDGEVVVLLHGFPQTGASWAQVCERLHRSGYRTLTFDQRGYAPTARPHGRRAYRMSALVSDVTALIAATGTGPVHLVGHNWGAVVAWTTAAQHPELVRTLTAVSVPHPAAFLGSMLRSGQALRSYYMALFQIPWLPEYLLGRPGFLRRSLGRTGMTTAQIAAVRADVIERGALTPALNWYRAIPFSGSNAGTVAAPTTYVWSSGDTALSRCGAELCERHVTGPYRLEIVDGSHWIPEEQPGLVANLIVDRIHGR